MMRMLASHEISSVLKLTMVGMKDSLTMTERILLQSTAFSPSRKQMDSSAVFTATGGLAMDRTSTKCCFLIPFTAIHNTRHSSLYTSDKETTESKEHKSKEREDGGQDDEVDDDDSFFTRQTC